MRKNNRKLKEENEMSGERGRDERRTMDGRVCPSISSQMRVEENFFFS